MSDEKAKWVRHLEIRIGRLLKGLLVGLALIFFFVVIGVLWALSTGRATEIVRHEFINVLHDECQSAGEFSNFELGVFPPQLYIKDLVVSSEAGHQLISVDEAIVSVSVFPLFYGRLQLERVALLRPQATLVFKDGQIENLPTCLAPSESEEATVPIALGVNDLQIERGFFRFEIPDRLDAKLDDIGVAVHPGASGGTDVAFAVDDGDVSYEGRQIKLDRVRLLAHVAGLLTNPRALTVETLELGVKDIELAMDGSIDLLGPVYEINVRANAPLEAARHFGADLPRMAGRVELETSVTGTFVEPKASGKIVVEKGEIAEFRLGDRAEIEFRANKQALEIARLLAVIGPGQVTGAGRIELDDQMKVDVDLTCQDCSLGRILDAVDVKGPWVDLFANGGIAVEGTILEPFAIGGAFDLDVTNFHTFDRAFNDPTVRLGRGFDPAKVLLGLGPTQVAGDWSADPEGIWFKNAVLHSGGSSGTADVRLHFEDEQGLYLSAELPEFDFTDIGPVAGVDFIGYGSLSAEIFGPYYDLRLKGAVDFNDLAIAGVPLGNVGGNVFWHDDVILDFEDVDAKLEDTHYSGQARVHFKDGVNFSIGGRVHEGRVEDLLIPFGLSARDYGDPNGKIAFGNFDVQGPIDQLTGPINLAVEKFEVLGEKAEAVRVMGRMESGALVADEIEFDKYGARLSGSGRWDPKSGQSSIMARARGLTLQKIDLLRNAHSGLDGDVALQLAMGGNVRGLTGTISAALTNARVGEHPLDSGQMKGKVRGGTVHIDGALLGGALGVRGEIRLAKKLPYKAKLTLNEYDVPKMVAAFMGVQGWEGSAAGRADLHGLLADWDLSRGELTLDRARVNSENVELESIGSARFSLQRGVLNTRRLVLSGANTRMTLAGDFGRARNDFKVQGRLDLAIVESVWKPVERSGGALSLNAVVRGSADRLDLVGTGKIERGVLQWRGVPSRLTGTSARLTFSQSSVLINEAKGRYAGGEIRAKGQVLLDGISPSNLTLDIDVEGIRPKVRRPGYDLAGEITGAVKLAGRPDQLSLRGAVSVKQGRFSPKFDWSKLVNDPLKRLIVKVYDPGREVLSYDIKVHFDPLARVKNETSDVEVTGDLHLTGTNERMGLLGTLSVLRGRVGFFGRAYDMRSGAVELADRFEISPRYDLDLRARACDALIDVKVTGTLDSFETAYFSNPEMDETSIVSCLKFGVKLSDTAVLAGAGGSVNDQNQQLATGLGMEALWRLSGVDRQVRKVLPVNQLEVTTEFSKRLRVYEPRIVVGKDLGFVQLQASSALTLSGSANQSAAARFRLTPELSLELGWRYSQFIPAIGDLGVDIKRRWEW